MSLIQRSRRSTWWNRLHAGHLIWRSFLQLSLLRVFQPWDSGTCMGVSAHSVLMVTTTSLAFCLMSPNQAVCQVHLSDSINRPLTRVHLLRRKNACVVRRALQSPMPKQRILSALTWTVTSTLICSWFIDPFFFYYYNIFSVSLSPFHPNPSYATKDKRREVSPTKSHWCMLHTLRESPIVHIVHLF